MNAFCRDYLNPYLNLHRPCLFAEERTDAKGKVVKRYPQHLVQTPLEKLASMSPACRNLRPETTLQALQVQARVMSDNEAADNPSKPLQDYIQIITDLSRSM